jgi:hypothetical protein
VEGIKGHVNADIIRENAFAERGKCGVLCGPPTMIQKAVLPALKGEESQLSLGRIGADCFDRLGLQGGGELFRVLGIGKDKMNLVYV